MRQARVLARCGESLLVAVDGDELPVGPFYPRLYLPVRRYDRDLDRLWEPNWWGSWLKFWGGYLENPGLDADEERRVLDRVQELLEAV